MFVSRRAQHSVEGTLTHFQKKIEPELAFLFFAVNRCLVLHSICAGCLRSGIVSIHLWQVVAQACAGSGSATYVPGRCLGSERRGFMLNVGTGGLP